MASPKRVDWTRVRGNHHKDRIGDFSTVGFGSLPPWQPANQGSVLWPAPDGRDRTADIQRALDVGGIVELADGIFPCDGSLSIVRSHTILRGRNQTVVEVRGSARTFLSVGQPTPDRPKQYGRTKILDDYIPAGAPSFRVEKSAQVKPGARIFVERRATAEWIQAMGMADLVRNEQPQTWIKAGAAIRQLRTVQAVEADWIILDTILSESLQSDWTPELVSYTPPSQTSNIGIANIHFRATPSHSGDSLAVTPSSLALQIQSWVEGIWIRNAAFEGFLTSVTLEGFTSRATIQDCVFRRNAPTDKSRGWPSDIQLKGTTALVLRCRTEAVPGAHAFAVATQTMTPGPNAVVEYVAPIGWLSPHQRYAMSILFERCDVEKIELSNRGTAGSGHGWPIANGVAYNCRASGRLQVEKPPLAQNWAIGCTGPKRGNGSFVEYGAPVEPHSLISAQMELRFGGAYAQEILGSSYRAAGLAPTVLEHLRPERKDEL